MFVYQADKMGSLESTHSKVNRHARAARTEASQSLLVVLGALVFGGVSKAVTFIPLAAFVATVLVAAWFLGEDASAEEPGWVNRLSLASTGLLYLGLGHCVGALAFLAAPVIWSLFREE